MSLLRRQKVYEYFDDQDPVVLGKYVGSWAHYTDHNNPYFVNYTYSVTTTPGSSLSLEFSGTQIWVFGGPLGKSYPAGNYTVDGVSTYYTPYTNAAGEVIYFDSQLLTDRPHTLEIRVTAATDTYPFILDVISCSLGYGGAKNNTMTTSQSPTSTKTIIGGVIGGVCAVGIIAVLLVFAYRSPNRRARDNQDSDVANPHVAEVLPSEYRSEPFNLFGPSPPTDFSGPGPQFGYSEGRSSRPLDSSIGEVAISSHPQHTQSGPTYITSNTSQSVNQKGALRSQQYENVQHSAPSYETRSTYAEVPPSYGHN